MSGERTNWITLRREDGYDFGPLVEAVSRIKVRMEHPGLVVDMSAITPNPYSPQSARLVHVGDGKWRHPETGQDADLAEWLFTFAFSSVDKAPTPTDSQEPSPCD